MYPAPLTSPSSTLWRALRPFWGAAPSKGHAGRIVEQQKGEFLYLSRVLKRGCRAAPRLARTQRVFPLASRGRSGQKRARRAAKKGGLAGQRPKCDASVMPLLCFPAWCRGRSLAVEYVLGMMQPSTCAPALQAGLSCCGLADCRAAPLPTRAYLALTFTTRSGARARRAAGEGMAIWRAGARRVVHLMQPF